MRNGLPTLKTNALRFLSAFTWIITFAFTANAANWYVRPNAVVGNNGSDWNNAWSLSNISWSLAKAGGEGITCGSTPSVNGNLRSPILNPNINILL
jgi:hypothetical protein